MYLLPDFQINADFSFQQNAKSIMLLDMLYYLLLYDWSVIEKMCLNLLMKIKPQPPSSW